MYVRNRVSWMSLEDHAHMVEGLRKSGWQGSPPVCGRVAQKTPLGEIRLLFETTISVPNIAPNHNA